MNTFSLVQDAQYFCSVYINLKNHGRKTAVVRFGEMGKGHHPNYQITDKNGLPSCYRGKGHKLYGDVTLVEFTDENLSPPLSFKDIESEIGRCRSHP